jgi:hypothetical protein
MFQQRHAAGTSVGGLSFIRCQELTTEASLSVPPSILRRGFGCMCGGLGYSRAAMCVMGMTGGTVGPCAISRNSEMLRDQASNGARERKSTADRLHKLPQVPNDQTDAAFWATRSCARPAPRPT